MSDAALGALLRALPFGALLLDERAEIICANGSAARLAGRAVEELAGLDFFSEFPALAPDEQTRDHFREAARTGFYSASVLLDGAALQGVDAEQLRVHVRALMDEGETRALVLLEPLDGESDLRNKIQQLDDRMLEIRRCRHEVNNLLMGLMGQGELLGGQPELSELSQKKVGILLAQCRRLRDELKKMALYTRNTPND